MEKCKICGESIKKDDGIFSTLKGEDVHFQCYEGGGEYASTIIKFENGEKEKTIFDNDFIYYSDTGEDWELPAPIKKEKWVNSDGWRGYTDWEIEDGFIEATSGWVTGHPDETTSRKRELGELFEEIESGELIPPVAIWWVFGHTSNVFSQASSIIVRDGDKDALEDWLNEINGGLEGLQAKFN